MTIFMIFTSILYVKYKDDRKNLKEILLGMTIAVAMGLFFVISPFIPEWFNKLP